MNVFSISCLKNLHLKYKLTQFTAYDKIIIINIVKS